MFIKKSAGSDLAPSEARLIAALDHLVPSWRTSGAQFLLAVSGGPDSMALLHLMHRAAPGRVQVATVDHQLRPESAAEAAMVADFCAQMGVPHQIRYPVVPLSGNLASAARDARYALLQGVMADCGAAYLVTAHHGDDQRETLLMRLARGSGVGGLAGVRARAHLSEGGTVIRPLLGFAKAELVAVCEQAALPHVHDPSNQDRRYDRAAMRHWLAKADAPFDVQSVTQSAAALADADDALAWMTDQLAASRLHIEGREAALDVTDMPREMCRRLLLRALEHLGAPPPRGPWMVRALDALASGRSISLGDWHLRARGGGWHITPAPPRREERTATTYKKGDT